jgi:hypothetical protein
MIYHPYFYAQKTRSIIQAGGGRITFDMDFLQENVKTLVRFLTCIYWLIVSMVILLASNNEGGYFGVWHYI